MDISVGVKFWGKACFSRQLRNYCQLPRHRYSCSAKSSMPALDLASDQVNVFKGFLTNVLKWLRIKSKGYLFIKWSLRFKLVSCNSSTTQNYRKIIVNDYVEKIWQEKNVIIMFFLVKTGPNHLFRVNWDI